MLGKLANSHLGCGKAENLMDLGLRENWLRLFFAWSRGAMRLVAISVTTVICVTLGARALGTSSGEGVAAKKPPGSDSIEALST